MSLIGKLFGTGDNPPDATKLDGATMAALARSLSALLPDERGWITFAEARNLFSTERAEYAFGELDQDGRKNIEVRGAEQGCHQLYAGRGAGLFPHPITWLVLPANVRFTPESGHSRCSTSAIAMALQLMMQSGGRTARTNAS
jgi:hypothetical protein